MRKTSLAFLALAFVIYWLFAANLPLDRPAALDPVLPSLVHMLPFSINRRPAAQNNDDKPDLTGIRHWLSLEAVKAGRVDSDPSATVLDLKKRALTLKNSELEILKATALSPEASGDERFLSVYIIGLAESAAARDFLKEIGGARLPSTVNDRAYSDEVVIRAHALDAVVKRLSPADSIKYLKDVLANTTDPAVARHARYWLGRLG